MTNRARVTNRRWLGRLLAAVAGVLVMLFGAGIASAAVPPTAQTRVGASATQAAVVVEMHESTGASQREGDDSATHSVKLASDVAARAGVRIVTVTGLATSYDAAGSNYDTRARSLRARGDVQGSAGAGLRESAGRTGRQTAIRGPVHSVSGFVVAAKTGAEAVEGVGGRLFVTSGRGTTSDIPKG